MKTEISKIVKEAQYSCDFCGEPARYQCVCCRKDICYKHEDDDGDGDCPDRFCKECWKIGVPFRKQIKELEEENYNTVQRLEQEWFKKARQQ